MDRTGQEIERLEPPKGTEAYLLLHMNSMLYDLANLKEQENLLRERIKSKNDEILQLMQEHGYTDRWYDRRPGVLLSAMVIVNSDTRKMNYKRLQKEHADFYQILLGTGILTVSPPKTPIYLDVRRLTKESEDIDE